MSCAGNAREMLDEGAPDIAPPHPPLCTVILTPKAEKSSDIFFMLSFRTCRGIANIDVIFA